ncbi:hypothetical protein [Corynebacterium mayonis]|uniref:hypothetical protein n=1 Tax=Corynebacterium mayonis TaxID=3062461 RepID=UPI0031408610
MTTTLAAPSPWRTTCAFPATAVLRIEEMPAQARWGVEKLLCSLPAAPVVAPLCDELDTAWFTRWQRTPAGYFCREILHAPAAELREFERALDKISREYNFTARVEMRPYHGQHV